MAIISISVLASACGGSDVSPSTAPADKPTQAPAEVEPAPPAAEAPSSAYGLPFAGGQEVKVGELGLHADNFGTVHGGGDLGDSTFTGQATSKASIDLWVPAGTPVYPVMAGTVRNADPDCDIVVVAHDTGEWSEYLHVAVDADLAAGDAVTTSTVLGTILPASEATSCNQHSGGIDHLHFAFAKPTGDSTAAWVELVRHALCGKEIDAAGNLGPWAAGSMFTVPDSCGGTPITAQATPSPSLTDPPPVLSGVWVAPKDGKTLDKATLTLSAKATKTLDDVEITKVAYAITWGSRDAVAACTAKKPDAAGVWACTADLWRIGAPLGKPLTLSFKIFDDAGDLAVEPDGTRTISFKAAPPQPTGIAVKFKENRDNSTVRVTLSWEAPRTAGTTIRVIGITECLAAPSNPPKGAKGTA